MMQVIKHKRGDTLRWPCTRTDAAGNAVGLSGVTITAHFEKGDTHISLGINITNSTAGEYELTADKATTKSWPVGIFLGDVTFDNSFGASSTETFAIAIEKGYFGAS